MCLGVGSSVQTQEKSETEGSPNGASCWALGHCLCLHPQEPPVLYLQPPPPLPHPPNLVLQVTKQTRCRKPPLIIFICQLLEPTAKFWSFFFQRGIFLFGVVDVYLCWFRSQWPSHHASGRLTVARFQLMHHLHYFLSVVALLGYCRILRKSMDYC